MTRLTRFISLSAVVAGLVAPLSATQAQGKPTVAIMQFNSGAIGPAAKDYEGLTKAIPGMLITDMAANPNIRLLERSQVQSLVDEQNLVKGGMVDATTATKVGKLLGVHHVIFGTYFVDQKGKFRIDARAVDVETGVIEHVERVDDNADNIMTAIGSLSSKLNSGMKLPAMRVGEAVPPSSGTTGAATPAAATPKLPMRVAVMYGKALDLADHGKKTEAVELFSSVLKEFPTYTPAQTEKDKLTAKSKGN